MYGNKASASGGGLFAVCTQDMQESSVNITGCYITSNSAANGGSVYMSGAKCLDIVAKLHVGASIIASNAATQQGGSVWVANTIALFDTTTFDTNIIESQQGSGGALYLVNSRGSLNECIMSSNRAEKGGAISALEFSVVNFTGHNIITQGNATYGGAIQVY